MPQRKLWTVTSGQSLASSNSAACLHDIHASAQWHRLRVYHQLRLRRQGRGPKQLREMLKKQEGRCALSGAILLFDVSEGTPQKGGRGCHPLYPAVDHMDPGNPNGDFQIVCYALNDLKGHMPPDCFNVLRSSEPWINLMKKWKEQAEKEPMNRAALTSLLRPDANSKKKLVPVATI